MSFLIRSRDSWTLRNNCSFIKSIFALPNLQAWLEIGWINFTQTANLLTCLVQQIANNQTVRYSRWLHFAQTVRWLVALEGFQIENFNELILEVLNKKFFYKNYAEIRCAPNRNNDVCFKQLDLQAPSSEQTSSVVLKLLNSWKLEVIHTRFIAFDTNSEH